MSFFDYVYYKSYYFYKHIMGDSTPMMYALCVVSLMQQFNVAAIVFALYAFTELDPANVNKTILFASFFIFLIPNYIRYSKFKLYDDLVEKWGKEARSKKYIGFVLVGLYVAATLIIFIASAVVFGKIKRGEL